MMDKNTFATDLGLKAWRKALFSPAIYRLPFLANTSKSLLSLLATSVFLIAACSADGDTSQTKTDSTEDQQVTKVPREISETTEVRDALAGTTYNCIDWDQYSENAATCRTQNSGTLQIHVFANRTQAEFYAALTFDTEKDVPAVILGDNWALGCHRWQSVHDCGVLARKLDAELIERGHWNK